MIRDGRWWSGPETSPRSFGLAVPATLARFVAPAARRLFMSISRSPRRDRPSIENQAGRRETMDEQTFQTKFNELLDKIKQLPNDQRGRLEHIAEQTKERRKRIQHSVAELQESLDYLRLSVKYLVFDLEATRRENAYLRRLIEQSNRDHNHTHEEDEDYDENSSAD
jgi:hypothetical protein